MRGLERMTPENWDFQYYPIILGQVQVTNVHFSTKDKAFFSKCYYESGCNLKSGSDYACWLK